ncbi:MAG: DUF3500 domain-containing protein [Gemmataceae bacterium]
MNDPTKVYCPDCDEHVVEQPVEGLSRRQFIRVVGTQATALAAVGAMASQAPRVLADSKPAQSASKPAEDLVRELYATLTAEQKSAVVRPYDDGADRGRPTRLGMYNRPLGKRVGEVFTAPQQELVEKTLRAICADEEGYRRISRNGRFDSSGSLQGCGVTIFGDPTQDEFCWQFVSHHLTVRCDGNFKDGNAFGGPMYYGHSANGYSEQNVFNFQTQSVESVYEALSEKQRQQAVIVGRTPGEQIGSVQFRPEGEAKPGIAYAELTKDQQQLVEKVMRDVLSPFRKEDVDEVMHIVKATGGMEKIHLAFYGRNNDQDGLWHFWRLEGPGFVWNYRVLPHVHTFVNISSNLKA